MISTLSDLIAQVESSGNQQAVRYEPLHQPANGYVSRMAVVAACSIDTARVLCSMSWGLYQIMGDELIAKGLNVSPIFFCSQATMQYNFFNRVLVEKGLNAYTLSDIIDNQTDREFFAQEYNGPGNVAAYSQRLLDVYKKSVTANTTSA